MPKIPDYVITKTTKKLDDKTLTDAQKILMLAFLMGVPLEWRFKKTRPVIRGWEDVYSPSWRFDRCDYRIKGTGNHSEELI